MIIKAMMLIFFLNSYQGLICDQVLPGYNQKGLLDVKQVCHG